MKIRLLCVCLLVMKERSESTNSVYLAPMDEGTGCKIMSLRSRKAMI